MCLQESAGAETNGDSAAAPPSVQVEYVAADDVSQLDGEYAELASVFEKFAKPEELTGAAAAEEVREAAPAAVLHTAVTLLPRRLRAARRAMPLIAATQHAMMTRMKRRRINRCRASSGS